MEITEQTILELIQKFASDNGRAPTVQRFAQDHHLHASALVRKFGSWNKLLRKAGLKPNKADKRSDDQLLGWLRSHPEARYSEIPCGIRNRLEERYSTISKARKAAGLRVADWRTATKRRRYHRPQIVGRPIEFTEEVIVRGLRQLAARFGRPPRIRDITKKNCGFTPGAVMRRFGTLNAALQAASLPVIYSHQEQLKLMREFEVLMMNVKLALHDIPQTYSFESDEMRPTFVYDDRCEDIYLKRSDIFSNMSALRAYKNKFQKVVAWFLIDDSLNEDKDIDARYALDIIEELRKSQNPILADSIMRLRKRYDDISRKYVGQPLNLKPAHHLEERKPIRDGSTDKKKNQIGEQ